MSSTPPVRAWQLTLKMEADSRDDLVRGLFSLLQAIERGEITTGAWGSPRRGCCYELLENKGQTHDSYFAQVRAYLEQSQLGVAGKGEP